MYKGHIVFDFDGTLISSMHLVKSVVREVLTEYLGREITEQEVEEKFDPHLEEFHRRFGLDESDHAKVQLIWDRKMDGQNTSQGIEVFSGIRELLNELKAKDFGLYLWTARDRNSTTNLLKELDIGKYFIDYRTGCDGPRKPEPQCLEELVGKFSKDEVIMIGDSYPDIQGAKNFGCHSIGVLWCPNSLKHQIVLHNPTSMVHTPQECLTAILNIFNKKG